MFYKSFISFFVQGVEMMTKITPSSRKISWLITPSARKFLSILWLSQINDPHKQEGIELAERKKKSGSVKENLWLWYMTGSENMIWESQK